MELIDTHSHIYDEAFRPDFPDVLARAREAGVAACVMPGIDRASYGDLCAKADELPGFAFPCIGLHPTSVGGDWQEELDFVVQHLGERPWRAVGEIGLDEYWSKDFVKEQMRVLEEQIVMASRAGLPVIIHLREATEDFLRVLEDLRGIEFRGTMHASSGARIYDVTVQSEGILNVSGAAVSGATVVRDANLNITDGGSVREMSSGFRRLSRSRSWLWRRISA